MGETGGRETVLVVDDFKTNVEYLRDFLEAEYRVLAAYSGQEAIDLCLAEKPDIILLDIMMPGMDGYETCRRLKADARTKAIPVVFVTALGEEKDEAAAFEAGGADFLTKPVKRIVVQNRVRTQLERQDQMRRLEGEVRKRTAEIEETRLWAIHRFGAMCESRDNDTGQHIVRMSLYCERIALAYGLGPAEASLYLSATPMHDVGKIAIPDSILLKPGKLDPAEFEVMKRHCELGEKLLSDGSFPLLQLAASCARNHHERWDGKGYPSGLAGGAIPLVGRITAVADVFDALTSKRPYKEAWPIAKAAAEIKNGAGSQFDPAVVEAFATALQDILLIKEAYDES
jgi:putative two-component system response regulator